MAQISKSCDDVFNQLVQGGVSPDDLYNTVCKQVHLLFFSCLYA
jgi:phosphoenolpyruvate carboxylase